MSDGITEMYKKEEKEKKERILKRKNEYYLMIGLATDNLIDMVINREKYINQED